MDMREASAMMEASGLVDDPDCTTPAPGARRSGEAADGMLAKDGTREFPEGVMQAHDA